MLLSTIIKKALKEDAPTLYFRRKVERGSTQAYGLNESFSGLRMYRFDDVQLPTLSLDQLTADDWEFAPEIVLRWECSVETDMRLPRSPNPYPDPQNPTPSEKGKRVVII